MTHKVAKWFLSLEYKGLRVLVDVRCISYFRMLMTELAYAIACHPAPVKRPGCSPVSGYFIIGPRPRVGGSQCYSRYRAIIETRPLDSVKHKIATT